MDGTLKNIPNQLKMTLLACFGALCLLSGSLEVQAVNLKPLPFDTTWRARRILAVADSGFARRRYAEAYQQYRYLLQERGLYSPQMLLKMSAYTESANDFTLALYYLNLYYLHNPSLEVRQKIEDLATFNSLSGYVFSELDYFLFLYNQYFIYICSFHVGMAFLFLGIMVYRKWRGRLMMYNPLFFLAFVLASAFTANFGLLYRRGIVAADQAMLMQGPSSGSDFVQHLNRGHKLVIKDQTDIWYKVEWQGSTSWINKKNLLIIEN